MRLIFLSLWVLSSVACGRLTTGPTFQLSAVVDQEQYDEAYRTISSLDYIPFSYSKDGCYARSLFMSMELAAKQIPSSAIFVFADAEKPLQSPTGVQWIFHVAPLLMIGATGPSMVMDPSLAGAPIPRAQWISMMQADPARSVVVPGSVYGSNNAKQTPERIINSFAELPPFRAVDIQNACETLRRFLAIEGAPDFAAKQNRLILRTQELSAVLRQNAKLPATDFEITKICGNIVTQLEGEGP